MFLAGFHSRGKKQKYHGGEAIASRDHIYQYIPVFYPMARLRYRNETQQDGFLKQILMDMWTAYIILIRTLEWLFLKKWTGRQCSTSLNCKENSHNPTNFFLTTCIQSMWYLILWLFDGSVIPGHCRLSDWAALSLRHFTGSCKCLRASSVRPPGGCMGWESEFLSVQEKTWGDEGDTEESEGSLDFFPENGPADSQHAPVWSPWWL